MIKMAEQNLMWIGHGSWKTVTNNGTVIYLDPWIQGNPSAAISMEDTMDAQIVCVTHGHSDHIGDAIEICKKTHAILVTLPEIAMYAGSQGIPYDDRGGAVHVGGSIREVDCKIRAVHALHHADVWSVDSAKTGVPVAGSGACGMVICPDGGKPIYFAGDTGLFSDMKLISELYKPYVAVLPAGDKYVMGINEASYAAGFINCPIVVPGHYNTTPEIEQDMDKFKELAAIRAPHTEVKVLQPGESFTF